MIKLKIFFPRLYQNCNKFYSKSAKKLRLTKLSEIQKKTTDIVSKHDSSVSNLVSVDKSSELLRPGGSDKVQSNQCAKSVDYKSIKGKKCGQPKSMLSNDSGPPGGDYIKDKCGFYNIPKTNSKKWKTISFALLPIVLGFSAFIFTGSKEHAKHQFIPYEYLNIYNKRFPWGDGKKSLFHGPNNIIPDEEERREDLNGEKEQETK